MSTTESKPVITFDHHGSEFAADPYLVASKLRDSCPIAWTNAHGGYWVLANHDDVAAAFRDHDTFSSAAGVAIPDLGLGANHIPVTVDPPAHAQYRHFLQGAFTRDAIAEHEPTIRAFIRDLALELRDRGSWEFMTDFSSIVPGTAILTILGMPAGRRPDFSAALSRQMSDAGRTDHAVVDSIDRDRQWMEDQFTTEIADRRATPRDDLLTHLVRDPLPDGRWPTDDEIINICLLLVVAGFHTTNSALGSVLVHLQRHPEDRAKLIHDPSLIPQAIEEIVRVYAPATGAARTLTRDVAFQDHTMSAGEKAYLFIMSADRDPRQFDRADEVDIDRRVPGNGSLAWGWGIHRCLGIHLARLLLRVELETILDVMPDFEIDLHDTLLSEEMGLSYTYTHVPASTPKPHH